jgi:hypothetical protein
MSQQKMSLQKMSFTGRESADTRTSQPILEQSTTTSHIHQLGRTIGIPIVQESVLDMKDNRERRENTTISTLMKKQSENSLKVSLTKSPTSCTR